ncbi:hypothetical protein WME76_29500 [Sorangium sp. So ce119]|uniref:hypothetical protein n=1 Tax=Sorangium sp. So ce119 TaxID=3133279 RepID=UPI003F63FC23
MYLNEEVLAELGVPQEEVAAIVDRKAAEVEARVQRDEGQGALGDGMCAVEVEVYRRERISMGTHFPNASRPGCFM